MEGDVLDAFAVIGVEVLLDLRAIVGRFVDRNTDAPAGARHRLRFQAGELALDVEIADLAEIEEPLVEFGPLRHAAAMHVVGKVVDKGQAGTGRRGRIAAPERLEALQGPEVDVVDGIAVGILGITVDKVDERVADALDRRNVELAGASRILHAPRAALDQFPIGAGRVAHAERHRTHARAVAAREILRERARLGVEDEVDVALLIECDILMAVLRDALEAEPLEPRAERPWGGRGIFDELETVGLDRVVPLLGVGHSVSAGSVQLYDAAPMSRVPLADFEPALKKRLEALWGTPPNLYRALANHPGLVAAWTEFSKMLRHDTRTPRALRELVILRGGQLMRSEYEWAQHLPMARKAGVREAQINALSNWRTSAEFDRS